MMEQGTGLRPLKFFSGTQPLGMVLHLLIEPKTAI